MQTLEELQHSEHSWCSRRAAMGIAVQEQYEGGGLEDTEFAEIMLRILDEAKLDTEATDLDTKADLILAFNEAAGLI